jgi:hypothetical protein
MSRVTTSRSRNWDSTGSQGILAPVFWLLTPAFEPNKAGMLLIANDLSIYLGKSAGYGPELSRAAGIGSGFAEF